MKLGNVTVKAAAWLYALRMSDRILGLIATIILARMLTPKDFGVVAIGTLVIGLFEVFTRSGLQHALIQAPDVTMREVHAVWSFEVLRGAALSLLMYFGAPFIAGFFNSPDALPILQAMSVIPLLIFLLSAEYTLLLKEIRYKQIFLIDISGTIVRVATGIWLAYALRNVWALAIAIIAGYAARLVASFLVPPQLPRLVWDFSVIRRHFGYGRHIMTAGAGEYVYKQADSWFVGRVMGEAALGLYSKAYQLGNLPTTQLAEILQRVLFPSFAKLQKDGEALRQAYLKVHEVLALMVAPLMVGLALYAEPFVIFLLGDQWRAMIPAFQILAVWGGIRAFSSPSMSLFRAIGRPYVVTNTTILKIVVMLSLLWPARHAGIAGIAAVVLFTAVLELPILQSLIARQLTISQAGLYRALAVPMIAAIAAGLLTLRIEPALGDGGRLAWGMLMLPANYLLFMLLASRFLGVNQLPTAARLVTRRLRQA